MTIPADPALTPQDAPQPSADVDVKADPPDELSSLRAELAAIKAKADDDKRADRDAKKRVQEEAKKAGELAKALEAAEARLAELEPAEPLAAKWRAYEADEIKRLDGEAAALPEAAKDLYTTVSDVDGKRKVLAAFRAAAGTAAPVKGSPPSMGAPAPVSAVDIEAALQDKTGAKMAEIKKRDPGAVSAFFSKVLGARANGSPSLGVGRFATTKAPNA